MKDKIIKLLQSTNRSGIQELLTLMELEGYFTAPASSKYHCAYTGGLMQHSYNVLKSFYDLIKLYKVSIPKESIILIALLHDLEKMNKYYFKDNKIKIVKRKGHALNTLKILDNHIQLLFIERQCIQYHMNIYGSKEFSNDGEFTLKELVQAAHKNELISLFHYADNLSAKYIEGKR
jgi:hypothetical protein